MGALSVSASAAVYTRSFTNELNNTIRVQPPEGNGAVVFYYEPMFLGVYPWATTGMSAPNGTVGSVFSFIACEDLEARSDYKSATEAANNQVQCTAELRAYPYATKIQFVAARGYNGTANSWDYTYTSVNHPY